MPVLIAIAFRDTGLATGVALIALVAGAGLLARFYLERLRLLLVARLTAIPILVVLLMAAASILFHRLDLEVGLQHVRGRGLSADPERAAWAAGALDAPFNRATPTMVQPPEGLRS
jgi:hypothetical protein